MKQNRLKIGGFGKCKVWMDKNDMASTLVESAMYMSPEMIQGLGYNFKADVWYVSKSPTCWRPAVAAYQWWPFALYTGNCVFVASQNRQLCEREQKESPQKRLVKLSVCKAKCRQFPQATHMPTLRHFLGTTAHQTNIIKCRNKHVQSAVLMFTYHEKE